MDVYQMHVIKVGPGLRERIGHFLAGQHHKAVVARLRSFREELEVGMQPEPWATLEVSAAKLLADVCDALALTVDEKEEVLGEQGSTFRRTFLDEVVALQVQPLNTRQTQAIEHLQQYGQITNREYQHLCPDVCTETLRLDLVDLVARGLLQRRGRCKGTYYVAVDASTHGADQ